MKIVFQIRKTFQFAALMGFRGGPSFLKLKLNESSRSKTYLHQLPLYLGF